MILRGVAAGMFALAGSLTPTGAGEAAAVVHPGRAVTDCPARRVYAAPANGAGGRIQFADATERWGADTPLRGMLAHAVATGDVNGDGWTDVFVGSFADRPTADYQVRGADGPAPDRLLLGGPEGFRTDVAFAGSRARTSGAAFADLDGDGRLDLVIARNVQDTGPSLAPTEILRNEGKGRLVRAATIDAPRGARSIGLLDYDRDGRTDLFVTEDRWTGGSSLLLRNTGNFRFEPVNADVGLPDHLVGMGVATADLTGDGAPDLFVGGSNRLFVNDGAGRFREVQTSIFQWPTFGTEDDPAGVAAGDVNRDGRIDLVVGEHYGSTIDFGKRVPVRLYLNQGDDAGGDPSFRDVTADAGLVGLPTKAPHVEIADFDADGWPDILASAAAGPTTPVVFRNLAVAGEVPRFAADPVPGPEQYWPSGAVLDADHDGRLDLVLADFDARRPSLVLRNVSAAGHWLAVAAPPGARLEVRRRQDGRDTLLGTDVVDASTGFGGGSPPVAWFGVGTPGAVEVQVRTADGRRLRLRDLGVDQLVSVARC